MKKFSIYITPNSLESAGPRAFYDHYLSSDFIYDKYDSDSFKENYPSRYLSRRFDKPAEVCKKWILLLVVK